MTVRSKGSVLNQGLGYSLRSWRAELAAAGLLRRDFTELQLTLQGTGSPDFDSSTWITHGNAALKESQMRMNRRVKCGCNALIHAARWLPQPTEKRWCSNGSNWVDPKIGAPQHRSQDTLVLNMGTPERYP